MKLKIYTVCLLFFACLLKGYSQEVRNIAAEQVGQTIQVSYKLETESPCTISLFYSTDKGANWHGPLQKVSGDIGGGVSPGFNKIKWNVIDELVNLISHDVQFKIEAVEEYNEMPPLAEETRNNNLGADPDADKVFQYVDEMPGFPNGGGKSMYTYIAKNIRYPQMAVDANITGKVFVNFVVDQNGNIADVKVLRGIGGGCDEEAIRLIKSMPKWTPGKQNGRTVKVSFNVPISFTLRN